MKLRRTHKREILRVEKKDDVLFSKVLVQRKITHQLASVDDGGSSEIRGGFSNER
jgi:hypothetical protein